MSLINISEHVMRNDRSRISRMRDLQMLKVYIFHMRRFRLTLDCCLFSTAFSAARRLNGNMGGMIETIDMIIGVNATAFGRKLTLFSAIALSRFSLKMSRFFAHFELGKKRSRCALLSVKWNSDESATSFHCSSKLMRSVCDTGKIRVASRRCTTVPFAPHGCEKY